MFKLSRTFGHTRNTPFSTFFCDVSLFHNDTFVDLNHSDITCIIKGNGTNFFTGETLTSKTGFVFRIDYNAKLKSKQIESTLSSAMISKILKSVSQSFTIFFIASKPDGNVIETTSNLVNFTKIDELSDITGDQKEEIKTNLVKDIVAFNEHEKAAEENQFIKRWVQSTALTNRIGKNARLRETLVLSINNTRNTFKGGLSVASRQASNSLTVDSFLEDIREQCEMGVNAFSGGLIGGSVICDPTASLDKYRRIDGVCNNLDNKHFGATGIAMRRFVPAVYADGKI